MVSEAILREGGAGGMYKNADGVTQSSAKQQSVESFERRTEAAYLAQ